jgi:hypothetical protein
VRIRLFFDRTTPQNSHLYRRISLVGAAVAAPAPPPASSPSPILCSPSPIWLTPKITPE